MDNKSVAIKFAVWAHACAIHASDFGFEDLLDEGDPYDAFDEMYAAFLAGETPESFVENLFEEDIAKADADEEDYNRSLEEEEADSEDNEMVAPDSLYTENDE